MERERKGLKESFKDSVYYAEQDMIRKAINRILDVLSAKHEEENDISAELCDILSDFRDVVRLYAEFEKR